jgi:hypothetical protein
VLKLLPPGYFVVAAPAIPERKRNLISQPFVNMTLQPRLPAIDIRGSAGGEKGAAVWHRALLFDVTV